MKKEFLKNVSSPDDLKNLSLRELETLADEIRSEIINTCAKVGGHLGASLGVVDLTIALHKVFESPNNPMVWDVGHQTYAHKILTGRKNDFQSIRQEGGISGFTKRSENPHDAFGAGHASTAISAALGIAEAKKLNADPRKVIAVVGDGALTGGLSFEGLNNAGHLKNKQLIVILNDNEMSIAPNVGAISNHVKEIVAHRNASAFYRKTRSRIKTALNKLEDKTPRLLPNIRRMRTAVKDLVGVGGFFEDLGFRYIGPIDGHNLDEMISTLSSLKTEKQNHPVLLHVLTKKGKGFDRAEKEPSWSHGPSPYCPDTGKTVEKSGKGTPKYTDIFSKTLIRLAQNNPNIVGVTAAMPGGTGIGKFADKFPERSFDVGIAEQHAATFSAGLATEGRQPVCAIYSTFMQRAYDGVIHDVALQNLPVVFALDRAGLVGSDGPTHHGVFDISFLRTVPNLSLYVPRDENQLQHHLAGCFQLKSPAALRYPRGEGVGVPLERISAKEPGVAECLHGNLHESGDLCFWGVGPILYAAKEAIKHLEAKGIKCTLVDAHTVKPLDLIRLKDSAKSHRAIITLEENALRGGFGSAVSEALTSMKFFKPVLHLGIPDRFIGQGTPLSLRKQLHLDPQGIFQKSLEFFQDISQDKDTFPSDSLEWNRDQKPSQMDSPLQ